MKKSLIILMTICLSLLLGTFSYSQEQWIEGCLNGKSTVQIQQSDFVEDCCWRFINGARKKVDCTDVIYGPCPAELKIETCINCDDLIPCKDQINDLVEHPPNLDNDPENECIKNIEIINNTLVIEECKDWKIPLPENLDNDPENECSDKIVIAANGQITIETGCGPITSNIPLTASSSPWDDLNTDTPATQSSADIEYDGGDVTLRSNMGTGRCTSTNTGLQIEHINKTQAIGFGYQGIFANGTNVNQELNINSKGNLPLYLNRDCGNGGVYIGHADLIDADLMFPNTVGTDDATVEGTTSFTNYNDYKIMLWRSTPTRSYGIGMESATFAFNSDNRYQFNIRGIDRATLYNAAGNWRWRWNDYGDLQFVDAAPAALLATQVDGDIVEYVDFAKPSEWTTLAVPTLTTGGTYTSNLIQNLETDTEWYQQQDGDMREQYTFHFSIRGVVTAGTGWGFVTVPQPAGWDREILYCGTYDAVPANDYDMDNDCHHWRNSGRVYIDQYRNKVGSTSWWTEITVRYKRN